MIMANLFTNGATTNSSRILNGTSELNTLAATYVNEFVAALNDVNEDYTDVVEMSKTDNNELDKLVLELTNVADVDTTSLVDAVGDDEHTPAKLLASVQSKRSRLKSKDMTIDNYKSLVQAAISEYILRDAFDMRKNSNRGGAGSVLTYSDEEIQALAADQEALKKAIRNIQSRKCIMKNKAGFDENSEQWLALLEAEEKLKAQRVSTRVVRQADTTKQDVQNVLDGVDIGSLKKDELRSLLEQITGIVSDEPSETEEPTDIDEADEPTETTEE